MESYKELEVWRQSIELTIFVYALTKLFPREEQYSLTNQVQRAATSIPANIAEGWGRGITKEYILHLKYSRGSLMELETHLIVAERLGYVNRENLEKLQREIGHIGKMLNGLIASLKRNIK